MSRLHKDVIHRLCAKQETKSLALNYFSTSSLCTGPGTGYDLREGASGLPAMCAYLASEELGNADVAEKVAQTASCLAPKVWRTTLKTVRSALEAFAAKQQEEEERPMEYEDLIAHNKLGRAAFVASSMNEVEKSLLKTGLLPKEFHPPSETLKVSVFVWVCVNLMRLRKIIPEVVLKEYDIPRRDYDDIAAILESECQDTTQKVRRKVEGLRARQLASSKASTIPATQSTVSLARTPSASPSRSAMVADSDRDASVSPQKTPTHKRKVAFAELDDADVDLIDTPSKRPRTASPAKPAHIEAEASIPAEPIPTPSTSTPASALTPTPNPNAISPMKPRRPSSSQPPRLPALAIPKPSIFPSTKTASVQSPLELLARRSSSRTPLNSSSPERAAPATRSQARPQLQAAPKPAPPATVAGPSTPSRRGRTPKADPAARMTPVRATPRRATPTQKRTPAALAVLEDEDEDEDEDALRPRRFRPVFLDQKQWSQRDPRAEREWSLIEARLREERLRGVGAYSKTMHARPISV